MQENNIFNRIYNQEVSPPPGLWNSIAKKLDEEVDIKFAPVVPISTTRNWLKIALAACTVGFIIMSTLWYVAKRNKSTIPTIAQQINDPKIVTKTDTVYIKSATINNTNTAIPKIDITTQPTIETKNNTVKTVANNGAKVNSLNNTNTPKNLNNSTANNNSQQTINPNNNTTLNNIAVDSNDKPIKRIDEVGYMTNNNVTGPSTQSDKAITNILSRISLSTDNEELDSIINNSKFWKNQIQEWRNKLIKSGYAPSLINQLDIIALMKLLEEKKK